MQDIIKSLEEFTLFGNTGLQWAMALGIFLGLYITFKIITRVILKRIEKTTKATKNEIDAFTIILIKTIKSPFYFFVSLYLASFVLTLNELFRNIILITFLITVVIQGILIVQQIIDYITYRKILKPGETDPGKEAIIKFVGLLVKAGIWMGGTLLILANLGVNVTAVIASLGILSIGVGLAVKDTVSDIFAAVTILIDKPFVPGDRIEVAGKVKETGIVKKIGIKTTSFRTKDGHDLLIANRKLTASSIQNFKKSGKRKLNFILGVAYETPLEKLKSIPDIIASIAEKHENAQVDRVIFKEYAASSLNFEVVITIKTKNSGEHLKILNNINYEIFEEFGREGIEFAYPTQTIHMVNSKSKTSSFKEI